MYFLGAGEWMYILGGEAVYSQAFLDDEDSRVATKKNKP